MDNGTNTVSLLVSANGASTQHVRLEMHQPLTGRFVGSLNGAIWKDATNLVVADIALIDPLRL